MYSAGKCKLDNLWMYTKEVCGCDAFNMPAICEVIQHRGQNESLFPH